MKRRCLCLLLCMLFAAFHETAFALPISSSHNVNLPEANQNIFPTTAKKETTNSHKSDKYPHDIDMSVLSDYIYDGAKATTGMSYDYGYIKMPEEWTRHKRPASLPCVGKAVIHIGDSGKGGRVSSSFYPGNPPINYHQKRLNDLNLIGYYPLGAYADDSNVNTAFYVYTESEFEVVAYNEQWVAVWDDGGVDTSRGYGNPCGGAAYAQYASWKPGVYFFPRQNCYILDINNQLSAPPSSATTGTSTCSLLIKTTPDQQNYVKAGVYKTNQSFQIIDPTPISGHYKVYYRHGAYYVDAQNVNIKRAGIKKPTIAYTAKVNSQNLTSVHVRSNTDTKSELIGSVKTNALIEIIQKDYTNDYSKIWFNSRECYIQTKYLTDFQKTPSGSGISQLGAPIGVMVIDSPWRAYGEIAYTAEGLAMIKKVQSGKMTENEFYEKLQKADVGSTMEENDWANVYKIENYSYAPDPNYPNERESGKIYTILFDGNVHYVVTNDNNNTAFTYYPGKGYNKTTVANTQTIYVDLDKYDVLAYNINGNNYFKLRDIAKMLTGSSKTFDVTYDASTNSINMLSSFLYTETGSELRPGDGATRTAYSSSAFLTYDGIPIKVTCYNINGNNYFKLRDITDALDCHVNWNSEKQIIQLSQRFLPMKIQTKQKDNENSSLA